MDLQLQVLEERRFLTRDVPSHWGDSEAAKALGLETYLSVPVYRNEGGGIFGTLCGACIQPLDDER